MNQLPQDFLNAMESKDYESLKTILQFMIYKKTNWSSKTISAYEYTNDYDDENDYSITYESTDWTPLADAAFYQDPNITQLILEAWPKHKDDLVKRTLSALTYAYDAMNKSNQILIKNFNSESLILATISLRYHMIAIDSSLQCHFHSLHERYAIAYYQLLFDKISQFQTIDDLLAFFTTYIEPLWSPYVKTINYFFQSSDNYCSNRIRLLIDLAQKKALDIIRLPNNQPALQQNCTKLLLSSLFSIQYERYGIDSAVRDVIKKNSSLEEIPTAIATLCVIETTILPIKANDNHSLFTSLYYLLQQALSLITDCPQFIYNCILAIFNDQESQTTCVHADLVPRQC